MIKSRLFAALLLAVASPVPARMPQDHSITTISQLVDDAAAGWIETFHEWLSFNGILKSTRP